MILTKVTTVRWNGKNKKWFIEKGYIFTKIGDEFEVNIEDLKPRSQVILNLQCDYCKKEFKRQNSVHINLIDSGSYKFVNKDACNDCTREKVIEIKYKKFELNLLEKEDKYYYFFRENRLKTIKDYIIENKTIDNLNECKIIIDMLHNYKENLYDIVIELGFDLNLVCSQLSKFYSYLKEEHIINIFNKFINKYGYFPSNKEIKENLNLNSYEIFRFGGIDNIKQKLELEKSGEYYQLNTKSIDLFKYNNISGIYKITNKINGKIYIGQAINLWQRITKGYLNTLPNNKNHNKHLQRAWNKYGGINFKIEIQEECNKDRLNEREQYWIDYYNSCDINYGYNICPEAGSNRGYKRSEESKEKMRKYTTENSRMRGNHHNEETKKLMSEIKKEQYEKSKYPIYQFDLNGVFIKEWASTIEASSNLDISNGNILFVIKKEKMTAGGFIWCKKEDYESGNFNIEESIKTKKGFIHPSAKKIVQLDLDENYIKTFDSIAIACESLDLNKCCISAILHGRQKQSKGHKFMYLEDYNKLKKQQRKDLI